MGRDIRFRVLKIGFYLIIIFLPISGYSQNGLWSREYGADIRSMAPTSDGGYLLAGDIDGGLWLAKINSMGVFLWQKQYGYGGNNKQRITVDVATDGNILVGAAADSFDTGIDGFWILKLDGSGKIIWQKAIDVGLQSGIADLKATTDGGCIVLGGIKGQPTVIKMDSEGRIQWEKLYDSAEVYSIIETSNHDYIFVGQRFTELGGIIVVLDSQGSMKKERAYGGNSFEQGRSIAETSDGGFAIAGWSALQVPPFTELLVTKFDSNLNLQWHKLVGSDQTDYANEILQTPDGGYIVLGKTSSFGTSVDYWLVKFDSTGTVQWQKRYDESYVVHSEGTAILLTPDNGYLIAGTSGFVAKVDSNGDVSPGCASVSDTSASSYEISFSAIDYSGTSVDVNATIQTTTAEAFDTALGFVLGCSDQIACPYRQDFDSLPADWTFVNPTWLTEYGYLAGSSPRKTFAFPTPAFAGCDLCTLETQLYLPFVDKSKISVLGWYQDKNNYVELLFKILKKKAFLIQKAGGQIVRKDKIGEGVRNDAWLSTSLSFDGSKFQVNVEGLPVKLIPAVVQPSGIPGFKVRKGAGLFSYLCIY